MKKTTLLLVAIILAGSCVYSQNYFRSGIFLHHSTGQYIWGPNNDGTSTTTVPVQMHLYNTAHNYNGDDSISMTEEWWEPGDNEWVTQHQFFEGNTEFTDINNYIDNNKIIVVKSCFPSSGIEAWGEPCDTAYPDYKTVYNYKWHWRHIIKVMKNHPGNFFAIWTNAPLETGSTDATQAGLSKKFCKWAKDTLAKGLDPVFGAFPPNVYVFDYFSKVTGTNGIELNQYRTSDGDSHPNGAATDLVAPQFVSEIFNAAIAYEQYAGGIKQLSSENTVDCFPNPTNGNVTLIVPPTTTQVQIINSVGQMMEKTIADGKSDIHLEFKNNGIYFVQITTTNQIITKKIIVYN